MTELKIGNGFGPSVFFVTKPSLFAVITDGASWNTKEFAKVISASINEVYFLPSKHELN